MHSTFFAGCLVSGVGEAMCVPVALPSGFPRGYMVLSHHLQIYTTIHLCLVMVGVPLLFCRLSIRASPPSLLVLFFLWVGACLCYPYNPCSDSLHPSPLCPLQIHWGRCPPLQLLNWCHWCLPRCHGHPAVVV